MEATHNNHQVTSTKYYSHVLITNYTQSENNKFLIRYNKRKFDAGDNLFGYVLQTPMVHVDDVAREHIFLLEHPNLKGRYNCSRVLVTIEKMAEVLSAKYPEFLLPTTE